MAGGIAGSKYQHKEAERVPRPPVIGDRDRNGHAKTDERQRAGRGRPLRRKQWCSAIAHTLPSRVWCRF